jgi:TRAP-type C4-dicarboxylate transport system permease small subunit
VFKKISSIWSKWEMLLVAIGCLAIFAVMCLTTVDVIMRNTVGKSLLGVMELISLLLMPIFVGALPRVQAISRNIILEFATEKASEAAKTVFDIFGCLVGGFVFISISKKLSDTAIASFSKMDMTQGVAAYPIWPIRAILALTVLTMVVRIVLDICLKIAAIRDIRRGKTAEAPQA